MTPTRIRTLLLLAACFGLFGTLLTAVVDRGYGRLLPVPLTAPVALAFMAVALLGWGLLAKPRLQRAPGRAPLNPIVAARTAALALAASRTGAVVSGFYLGVALGLVGSLQTPAGREYALASVSAAVAGFLLTLVGLWVESLCRLRGDDDSDGSGAARPRHTGHVTGEAARQAP